MRAFLAVADSGSFSAAARQLNLTQPAVSKRVQSLEQQLGTRVFDRAGKQIFLTDAGELLLPRARQILQDISDTQTLLQNLDGRIEGRLRLATSHHVGLHRLSGALRRYAQQYPHVHLDLSFVDSEVAHEMVASAEADLAVVTLNPAGHPALAYQRIWTDPLSFVATAEHELYQCPDIPLRELTNRQAILPGLSTFTGRIIRQRFAEENLDIGLVLSTNYLETIGMMVSIGLGWSVLPQTQIQPPIKRLDVATAPMARHLGAVTHPGRTLPNSAQAFLEVLAQFADAP